MWLDVCLRQCAVLLFVVSTYLVLRWHWTTLNVEPTLGRATTTTLTAFKSPLQQGICSLNHDSLFYVQFVNFRARYVTGQRVASVAVFGCNGHSVAALLSGADQFLYVRQGYSCGEPDSEQDVGAMRDAPLLDRYRELRGIVPDIVVFPSGIRPLLNANGVVDSMFSESVIPTFGRHMLLFDMFYAGEGIHSMTYFVKSISSWTSAGAPNKHLRVVEAHNITSLTIANVRLQRDIAKFSESAYSTVVSTLCSDEVLRRLESAQYEFWYIVMSWTTNEL
jgi:hypothetical protein